MADWWEIVAREFRACGFSAAGAVSVDGPVEEDRVHLQRWLDAGYGQGLDYLERSREYRHDLRRLMPEVQSVVVTLTSYNRGDARQALELPRIARYAWGPDYHVVIKQNLRQLLVRLRTCPGFEHLKGRAVVDSSPAFEKAWALRAGLGWQGRNSLLVHPRLGSYVLIGLLLLDCPLPSTFPTPCPLPDACGRCRRCVEACPGGAIVENEGENENARRVIDVRRCISHLTQTTRRPIESWAWGCDCCQEVCPYNTTDSARAAGIDSPLAVGAEGIKSLSEITDKDGR